MKTLLRSTISMLLTKEKEVQAIVLNVDNNGYLIAQFRNERAVIAPEDISMYQKDENNQLRKLLGSTIHASVIGKDKENILLSRKNLMQRKFDTYKPGDIVEATINSFSENAMYLEFDEGLIGKMYTNQITSAKVERPMDLYDIGDKVKCVIVKKQPDGRFLLSRLSYYKNNNNLNIQNGDILKCKITQKLRENSGYFVEVTSNPNFSGIFDINKHNCKINYRVGDTISLRVVDVKGNKQLRFRTNLLPESKKCC